VVGGDASFTAGESESVTLANTGNDFSGTVTFAASGVDALQDVAIHSDSGLALGASTLDGELTASTDGAITQSGALVVGGDASFTVGDGESIRLGTAGNEFGGSVAFAAGGSGSLQDVTVHSSSALSVGGST